MLRASQVAGPVSGWQSALVFQREAATCCNHGAHPAGRRL